MTQTTTSVTTRTKMMDLEEGLSVMAHSEVVMAHLEEAMVLMVRSMAYFHPPRVVETAMEAIMDHSHLIMG